MAPSISTITRPPTIASHLHSASMIFRRGKLMTSVFFNGRWLGRFAALVLTALVAAGCVGATASGSASVLPADRPTETASASASAIPTATPTATPTAVVDPLPSVPPAPSGTWKSINWTALPTTPEFGAHSPAAGSTFQVFGWSRGYVGFAITPGQPTDDQVAAGILSDPTVVSSYSADGVHWHTGQKLDTAEASSNLAVIRTVIEGPAGLLAVGWWGSCASEFLDSLWTSTDGISWQPVNVSEAFGQQPMPIAHISGGAAGYVAVAYKSAAVWTSKDGRVWQRVPLGTGPLKNSLINDGTAVSGGFVLVGTEGTADCEVSAAPVGPAEPTPAPVLSKAAVWWSADSSSWTHVSLPGAVAGSGYQDTWVSRLGDQSLLVVVDAYSSGSSSRSAWASKDGRTWTSVKLPADINQPAIISGGQHNLIVEAAMGTNDIGDPMVVSGKLGLQTIDDGFSLVSVNQSGDVPELLYSNWGGPNSYGMVALGPTGVVLTNADGSQLWFGTPSAK
jgi:hypothetical protein